MFKVSTALRLLRPRLIVVAGVFAALAVTTAFAYLDDAFEFERWTGQGDGTFSLTHQGQGCWWKTTACKCDLNDHRFKINVNRSSNRRDWKAWSGNSRYQRTPSGRPIYGYSLDTTTPHICVGAREFNSRDYPSRYWTTSGVAQNLYTWRR